MPNPLKFGVLVRRIYTQLLGHQGKPRVLWTKRSFFYATDHDISSRDAVDCARQQVSPRLTGVRQHRSTSCARHGLAQHLHGLCFALRLNIAVGVFLDCHVLRACLATSPSRVDLDFLYKTQGARTATDVRGKMDRLVPVTASPGTRMVICSASFKSAPDVVLSAAIYARG